MQTYTPPQGNTVAGQQLAAGQAQQANPVAGVSSLPTVEQSTAALGPEVAKLGMMGTPSYRQNVLNQSDIPAMTANYEDVAKKLYDYDNMYLKPAYSQAPGTPSDAASFGRVPLSSLMQLTPELAGGPTTLFNDNPLFAVTSQANQKGNILDLLKNLSDSISKEATSMRGKYASSVAGQRDVVNTIKGLIGDRLTADMQKEKLANDITVAEINQGILPGSLGMGDPNEPNSGNSLDNINNNSTDPRDERQRTQNLYNSFPAGSQIASRVAANWERSHGTPLFPNPPKGADIGQIKTSADALNRINEAIDYIKTNPDIPLGIVGGNIQDMLIGGIAGINTADLANPKTKHLYDLLKPLEGAGDRSIVGGRLSSYLQQQFKGAFPSIALGKEKLLDSLNQAQSVAQDDLNAYAQAHGYNDYTEMPGVITGANSATSGSTIHVRVNSTGQTGTIPAGEFDPKLYTKIQ